MSKGTVTVREGRHTDAPTLHVIPRSELRFARMECPFEEGVDTPGTAYWLIHYQLVGQPERWISFCAGEDNKDSELLRKRWARQVFEVISNATAGHVDRDVDLMLCANGCVEISFVGRRL